MKYSKGIINVVCLFVMFSIIYNITIFVIPKTITTSNIKYNQGGTTSEPRIKYSFNYDWKFAKGTGYINKNSNYTSNPVTTQTVIPTTENPYETTYTLDSRWKDVSLPHTFNDEDTFDRFMENGMNGERSMYTGTAWYNKEFTIPNSYQGKRIYLEFEAARQAAEVYLNGVKLTGKYENGFIPFGYDLTSNIKYGETNKLTVMVDNSFPYYLSSGNTDAITWHDSHWHPNYGGLYRNSYLYVVDNLHLTLPLYSFTKGEGTYVYTTDETNTSATVHIDAQVENNTAASKTFYVRAKIKNKEGDVVKTVNSEEQTISSNTKKTVKLDTILANTKRWSTKYPYLYTVDTEIYELDDSLNEIIIDNNSTDLGIRTFRFTNDYGFYLNNHYVELNGWGQKTTNEWAGLGAAYPNWMQDYVIKLMKDANANYIRWGHVAGSPKQIQASDKYGILVTQPGVDGEGGSYGSAYTQKTLKLRIEAFRDMLIQYRNHPSIIMWEVGNQSDIMSTTMTSQIISSIDGLAYSNSTASVIQLMSHLIKKYDYGNRPDTIKNSGSYDNTTNESSRLTTIRRGNDATKDYIDVGESTEGAGSMNTSSLGNKPAVEGEYNRLEVRRGVWDYKSTGFLNFFNITTYGDEYKYVTNEEFAKAQITKKKSVLLGTSYTGGANWLFSDSISHGRITSEVARASGEVDAVMLPKESYYVDKVIFGNKPGIHIIGHWNYPVGTIKDVYVAAKGVSTVQLYVNGNVLNNNTITSDYLYTFSNVEYAAGTIKAVGKDINGNVVVEDTITTHGEPDHIVLTKKQSGEGLRANGSDILLVDAEIVDAAGNRCVTYDGTLDNDQLHFNITDSDNAFIYRGGYNSSIENSTNSEDIYVEAGITRVALRTTMDAGTVSITASTDSGLSTTQALSATSTSVTNTNGLCELDEDSTFNLTEEDPEIGNNLKPGAVVVANANASVLITNFSYTGTANTNNKIQEAFSVGKKLYSDESSTFTSMPYKYNNAEFLQLPNADKGSSTVDLINFEARRDINVYVLRDSRSESNPSWMSDYSNTGDTIIGGNGTEYDVYKKEVDKNTSITMGGNSDDGNSGLEIDNNIIMFKETSKINSYTFFNETFDDFDVATYRAGWNAYIGSGNIVNTEPTVGDNSMHFLGQSTEDMVYVQKKFAPQSKKFTLTYKAYVTDNETNKYNRIFLTNDYILNDADKSAVAAETYLSRDTTTVTLIGRDVRSGVAGGTKNLISNISLNAWHTFTYYVDIEAQNYKVKIDSGNYSSNQEFLVNIDSVDNIVFGGGKAFSTDLYFDDVEITPIVENIISNLKIDNNPISQFDITNNSYYISNLTSTSDFTFDTNEYYKSSTITYDSENDRMVFVITDVNDATTTYYFYNLGDNTILNDWDVHNSTDALIKPGTTDGTDIAIHLGDTSTSNMAYMQKQFGPETQNMKFSFDSYITNVQDNTWLRVWLTDGVMLNNKSNIGIGTYLHRENNVVKIGHRSDATAEMEYSTVTATVNTWHHFEYQVDVETQTYDVYIDDVLALDDIPFYLPQTELNYMVFGTGGSYTSDYYLKNINYEHINNSPLTGIKINEENISNFLKETTAYNYYTEDVLSVNTDITLTTEEFLKTSNIEKDTTNQVATITVTNANDMEYVYTIHFINPSQMNTTAQELQVLINTINDDYDSTNYTTDSWQKLQLKVATGNNILAKENPTSEEISTAYYEINKALDALLLRMDLTTYNSGYIDNIKHSSNYLDKISFNKVLDNNKTIYKNDTTTKFRSVPYKYLNAEYIKLPNEQLNENGEISFITTRDMYLLVFKDRNSGVLTDSTYTNTGDIVTSNEGVVYKVYKKFYASGTNVIINTKELIQNLVTNNNNIVAFKSNYAINNNKFIYEDFNEYTTDLFKKSWNYSEPSNNVVEMVDVDDTVSVNNSLHLVSSSTTSMPFVYHEFAKIYDKFKVSYKAKTDTSVDNKWNRIWILNGEIADGGTDWRENVDTKDNILLETYLTSVGGTYSVAYRSSTVAGQNSDKTLGAFTGNNWGTVTYTADVKNKKFDSKVESTATTNKTNLSFLDADTKTFEYADNIELAGRKTGNTNVYFDDIIIEPIARTMASSITIDSNNISTDYTALTKDYLYSANSIASKEVTVTTDKTKTQSTTTNYENINLTDSDSYEVNHRIYYEINTNRLLLTEYVELALSKNESDYTSTSWDDLITALNESKLLLANSEATQSEIDTSATNLKSKIDALIDYNGEGYHYSGTIYEGNLLDGVTTNDVVVTNDSSVTIDSIIDKNTTTFSNDAGVRTLKSSTVFKEGTNITLIDDSGVSPEYYYYIVTDTDEENEKQNYLLSDFIKMGTTDENYVNKSYYSSNRLKEHMQFIVDFKDSVTKLSNNEYTLKYESIVGDTTINMDNLTYTINNNKGIHATSAYMDKEIYEPSDDININLTHTYTPGITNDKEIIDTTRYNKKYGIIVSLYQNSEKVNLPKGTNATIGDNICYTTDGICKLPASTNLDDLNINLNIDVGKYDLLADGQYDLKLDIIESPDGKNEGNVVGSSHQLYVVDKTQKSSFKVELTGSSNIVKKGTQKQMAYTFETLNTTNKKIVAMLEKKEGNTFETIDLESYVQGGLTNYSINNYDLGDVTTWTPTIVSDIPKGTYRIIFKLYSGSRIANTEKQIFIVK